MKPRLIAPWAVLLACVSAASPSRSAEFGSSLSVFCASSLTSALQDLGDAFSKQTSVPVKFTFGPSLGLAHQIEQGAATDVFVSADSESMDELQSRHFLKDSSRRDVVGNRLVLIARSGSPVKLKIEPQFALAEALGRGRLATGDPAAIQVGRYALAALTQLGVWPQVSDRIVKGASVEAVLAAVDRGAAVLGIVYQTDALLDRKVRVIDVFPADSHPPIIYPAALTRTAPPAAAEFVTFITGPSASATFRSYGFTSPNDQRRQR